MQTHSTKPRRRGQALLKLRKMYTLCSRRRQRVDADHGLNPSQQKLMISGRAQQLEDSVALSELLVSGVPVGGVSSAGWSELHLELRVRGCALRSDNNFRVRRGLFFVLGRSARASTSMS